MRWVCIAFDIHSGHPLSTPEPSDDFGKIIDEANRMFGPSAGGHHKMIRKNHRGVEWEIVSTERH